MNRDDNTSASLLEQVRRHDPDAWKRLVCLYGPLVLSWCQRWGVQREDAQDVIQEVFLAVSKGLAEFHRDGTGGFRSWVRGITRHKVLDHHRRLRRQPALASGGSTAQVRIQAIADADLAGCDSDEDAAELPELYRRALALIRDSFEEKTWQAFWRSAVDGRDAGTVGAELGMSPVAVRIAKSRVLARLRREAQGLLD